MDLLGNGAITDIDGVLVGHHRRTARGWCTGTTVVLVPAGAIAAVDVRGGGPGTRETDALDPRNLVDRVHAICLTGGSAYGLAAADGVMAELERRGLGVPVGPEPHQVVPVVPAAVIFDLGRGGTFGNRPDAEFGARAVRSARRTTPRGSVGAGTGAIAGALRGGLGTASTTVLVDDRVVTVAALVVVNASGSAVDPDRATPWWPHPALRRPVADERRQLAKRLANPPVPPLNTTIGVVATDAALTRPEVGRLAQSAHDGLARAIRPAHALTDGDTIFGLALPRHGLPDQGGTLVRGPESRVAALREIFATAADVFATACTDAIVHAAAGGPVPSYGQLCPSAMARLGSS